MVLLGPDLAEIAIARGGARRILAPPDRIDLSGISGTPNTMREWAGVEGSPHCARRGSSVPR